MHACGVSTIPTANYGHVYCFACGDGCHLDPNKNKLELSLSSARELFQSIYAPDRDALNAQVACRETLQ